MYALARRTLRLTPLAGFLAGIVFGLGGFALARVENINQLNGLAWLPGLLWLADETARAADRRGTVRWGAALILVIALSFLAGHTQTFFVNMVALGLFAVSTAICWRRTGYGGAGWRCWRLCRQRWRLPRRNCCPRWN